MKLLVLAQTPPPMHGQSLMVRTLVEGLPAQGIAVHHVNLRLSYDASDIGRWRPAKILAVLCGCLRAVAARFRHGCDTLYYVPAPGKRGALYRDWTVMLLCRPFFRRLVLHWHATGLGEWLAHEATAPERWLTRWLLGRADLSLVLADSLRDDAETLGAKKIAVVSNGIADPFEGKNAGAPGARTRQAQFQVLYLGLCSEEKGLFAAAGAVIEANRRVATSAEMPTFVLQVAGPFPDHITEERFAALSQTHPTSLRYCGMVQGDAKHTLLADSDCLCMPTHYPHEGQPLVLLEALAYDLPVIATRWHAIPETLPPEAMLVEPGDTEALAGALVWLREHMPSAGVSRAPFLANFTTKAHLNRLAGSLLTLEPRIDA